SGGPQKRAGMEKSMSATYPPGKRPGRGTEWAVMIAPDPPVTDAGFRLRSIAVSAYGPTLVAAIGSGAMLPVVALAALALGASTSVAAFTTGLVLIAELVFAVPAGALVHRIGERRSLLVACVVDAAASLLATLAPTVGVLM